MILEFFDQADAFYVAVIVFCNILSLFTGLRKESFPDIIMNGFFGNPGALN